MKRFVTAAVGGLLIAVLTFIPLAYIATKVFDAGGWQSGAAVTAAVAISLAAGATSFVATLRRYR